MFLKISLPILAILSGMIPTMAHAQWGPTGNQVPDAPWFYDAGSLAKQGGNYDESNIAVMTYCTKEEIDQFDSNVMISRIIGAQSRGGVVCPCAEQTYLHYGANPSGEKYPEVQYIPPNQAVYQHDGWLNTSYPVSWQAAQAILFKQLRKKHPDAQPMGILNCFMGGGSSAAVVPPSVMSATPSVPKTTQSTSNPGGNAVAAGGGTNGLAAGLAADNGSAARNSIDKYAFCRRPGRSQASIDNCLKAIAQ
jgi:hypothetical protein